MNERLIVKSLGPVKELDITFRKVTLFIGDQGTGKSCVAKLFSTFMWLEKALSQKRYPLSYFEQFNRFKRMLCAYHRLDSFVTEESYVRFEGHFHNFEYDKGSFTVTDKNEKVGGIAKIMYTPAERSIVSVAENKTKLLKELPGSAETFSDEFAYAKEFFKDEGFELPFEGLSFEYDSLNNISWISAPGYKVRLANSASGIQSSLPMCMVSASLSRVVSSRKEISLSKKEKDKLEKRIAEIMRNDGFSDSIKDMMIGQLSDANRYDRFIHIVEEPELNLFPHSQMEVLKSLVADNASSEGNMLVLTTHSPYTLAIINAMIMGAKASSKANDEQTENIEKVLPQACHIPVDDIAAYRLSSSEATYCKSVINEKTGLISKNDLDSASDEIMHIFNSLYQHYAKTLGR